MHAVLSWSWKQCISIFIEEKFTRKAFNYGKCNFFVSDIRDKSLPLISGFFLFFVVVKYWKWNVPNGNLVQTFGQWRYFFSDSDHFHICGLIINFSVLYWFVLFVCCCPVYCMPNVACFSGLSILDCSFSFL